MLGFQVVMDHGWIVTLADADGHQLSLMTQDATAEVDPSCSVFVDDIEAAFAAAQEAGLEIVHPLSIEDWGVTRFFYRDSAGNVINVGTHTRPPLASREVCRSAPDPSAACRRYRRRCADRR